MFNVTMNLISKKLFGLEQKEKNNNKNISKTVAPSLSLITVYKVLISFGFLGLDR